MSDADLAFTLLVTCLVMAAYTGWVALTCPADDDQETR